ARAAAPPPPAPAAGQCRLGTQLWGDPGSSRVTGSVRAEPTFASFRVPGRRQRENPPHGHVRLALVLLERAPRLGVARATLLRDAQLDERQLRDPSGRIPLAAIGCLWGSRASHA